MNTWIAARREAAWRRRRIIMNNDGDDVFQAREPTPRSFWEVRCTGLEGSHLDSIFYCTNISFNLHTHDSHVAELFTATHEMMFPNNHTQALVEQGKDNLQLVIDFCRRNDLEVFWSLRMNDTHDAWHPWMPPQFKRDHPELLLFRQDDIGKPQQGLIEPHMNATTVDYGRREIRDRQFEIIRDVCERYDIDGIELDFMRQPIFFRPTLDGLPVGREHLQIMTNFITRVRQMAEKMGKDRGKPILIAISVPNTPSLALSIGLDVEQWLKDDLIDIAIASLEHTPFTGSITEMVELAHRHDAPIYARLSGNLGDIRQWAGAEVNARHRGVDGIQTFNIYHPQWEGWQLLGDPSATTNLDKTFAAFDSSVQCRTWEHVIELEGRLPVELAEGNVQAINLWVGDDIAGIANDGKPVSLSLTITLDRLTYSDEIEFQLNGHPLKMEVFSASDGVSPVASGTFVLYACPDPVLMKLGDNTIEALLRKRCASSSGVLIITDVQLMIHNGDR